MNWLTRYYAMIIRDKKIIRIPLGDKTLMLQRNRSDGYASIVASKQSCLIGLILALRSSDIVHQKEGWILQDVHRQPRIEHTNREEPLPLPSIDDLFDQVMPFCLISTLEAFMDLMNWVCKPYLDKFVIVFIDDISICSSKNKEYEEHLRLILGLLKNKGFYAKFSKCEFWLLKVQFLGHVVDSQGIHVDTAKIESIKD
ncbi:putative reverse transcriptase domain-containing protein [Tanacetum coccineum]